MTAVIEIDKLSKQYRLGSTHRASYHTLRDTLSNACLGSLRRMRGWTRWGRNGQAAPQATAKPSSIWALKDVSFQVEQGEVMGIVGRNGAGKSTLLKILSQITEPTSGEARLRGRLGSLLEVGTGFHPELTGRENIFLNGAMLGMKRREIAHKFDEIVAFSEVEPFLDTPVKNYSSGMYVRLAFGVAAHLEPEILIIDEVLAVGDIEFQRKCLGKMDQVARSGRTILFVSHNLATVQNLCRKVVLLAQGQVAMIGETSEVLSAYLRSCRDQGQESAALSDARQGGMAPIIRDVKLLDENEQPTEHFFVGRPVTIQLEYDSELPLPNPIFAINFSSLHGEWLFHLQTLSQCGPLTNLPQKGTIRCRIPSLPLLPGTYMLSFTCANALNRNDLDCLVRARSIHVVAADYFGTGLLPPARNGPFLVKADWNFSSGETSCADMHRVNGDAVRPV